MTVIYCIVCIVIIQHIYVIDTWYSVYNIHNIRVCSSVFLVSHVWRDHFLQVAVKAGKLSNSLFKRLDVFRQMLRGMDEWSVREVITLPETNIISPLKIDGWKTILFFWGIPFFFQVPTSFQVISCDRVLFCIVCLGMFVLLKKMLVVFELQNLIKSFLWGRCICTFQCVLCEFWPQMDLDMDVSLRICWHCLEYQNAISIDLKLLYLLYFFSATNYSCGS